MTSAPEPRAAPPPERSASSRPRHDLASRGSRLGAALLDGLLGLLFVAPALYALGLFEGAGVGSVSTADQIGLTIAGLCGFLILHGYLLYTRGQTVGKRLVGIRIVRRDRSRARFGILVGLRVVPVSLAAQIPLFGPFLTLLDILFIFGAERRCIHDRIADTVVIRASA